MISLNRVAVPRGAVRNQLPRQERETFMGLLRFLSLPVDDVWFSAVLLILVRR